MALEFFLRNICVEIEQVCKAEAIECHRNFVLYYLKLLAFDPMWNLHRNMSNIDRNDAVHLIRFVVKKLQNPHCPCIIALKMQFYFVCNFDDKDRVLADERFNFNLHLKPLVNDIIESTLGEQAENELLYKKIVFYCVVWPQLGNPTIDSVYREAYHALLSILNQTDMEAFTKLQEIAKLDNLQYIARIHAGVRLFNWTNDQSGEGIVDARENFIRLLSNFKGETKRRVQSIADKIDTLTTALEATFLIETVEMYNADGPYNEYKQICVLPYESTVEYEDVEYFKDLILIYRMIETYNRQFTKVIDDMELNYDRLIARFQDSLELFGAINLKAGVETSTIFPMFVELSNIWQEVQDEIVYLKRLMDIQLNVDLYVRDCAINYEKIEQLLGDKDILMDCDRLEVRSDTSVLASQLDKLNVQRPSVEVLSLTDMEFEFAGFDVWRLVESQGALIPGNPNLGIVIFDAKQYVFSCTESATMFSRQPQSYINEALELARRKPELIPLLGIEEHLAAVQDILQCVVCPLQARLVAETKQVQSNVILESRGAQTEMHPVSTNIDKQYMWNIWALRHRAVELANQANTCSVACNTSISGGATEIGTQTQSTRHQQQQTRRSIASNTPQPRTYFFGLRGRSDDRQFVLDVSVPREKAQDA